jgi:hypothetical protein
MDRLKRVVIAVAVAVAVALVGAGAAAGAKGGNNDNAHACQQGGHQTRFEAETGNPFKNAGGCASHGAKGGASSSLQLQAAEYGGDPLQYWGILNASGLQGGSQVTILDENNQPTSFVFFADPRGNLDQVLVGLPCDTGDLPQVSASGTTPQNQPITSPSVTAPC